MLDVIKTRYIWFVVSAIIIVAGITSITAFGLRLGIDFKGGSLSVVQFQESDPTAGEISQAVSELELGSVTVQKADDNTANIRTVELSPEQRDRMHEILTERFGNFEELRFDNIGPTISNEITRRAVYQLILVTLGILGYIAWAFRRVPRPLSSWRFGWAAIVALLHDLLVVVGIFAILGKYLNVEIDALFVTALLTVLGFSVHDTIIVFDRIRENLKRRGGSNFAETVTQSINETLVRSINTSTTVIFVLLTLLLFGGENIRYFVLALLIGITAGTYSSIFIASPLLYVFHQKKFDR